MIDRNLYKKSYLLEIFNRKTAKITDAFCFSVPPESEELTYSHRNSQTKTFGGICVDRYGNDAIKISLSGNTINQEVRYIYRSSFAAQNLTGEQEIYYLRDLLEKVGEDSNSEMRLYDLSKSYSVGSGTKEFRYVNNWWIVYLDTFRIKRSKEKPMAYTYQIEFTGEPKNSKNLFKFDVIKIKDPVSGITSLVEKPKNSPSSIFTIIDNGITKMRVGLGAMETALDKANGVINQIYTVRDKVEEFADVFNDYADAIQNFHTFKEKAVQQTVKVGTDIIKSFTGAGMDVARGVVATGQILFDSVTVLKDLFDEGSKIGWKDCYTEEKLNALETTYEELADSVTTSFHEVLEGSNDIEATMKKTNLPEVLINTDQNGNDYPVVGYGSKAYILKDGDSIEEISYKSYGSTDYVPMLEMYNDLSDDELEPGKEFRIPILEPQSKDFNNNIYETKDNIGTDIQLTEDGDIAVFGGDFKKISGDENLQQAIEVRLSAYMGANVRNILYGLRNSIGDNQSSNAYLLSSLEQTLAEEPRIAEVNSISYVGRGDSLYITIDYTNINNVRSVYQGEI